MTESILKPISIVIPIKNRAHYLPNLIKNLINLNYPEYEIIFINDCSTDNTMELMKQFPVKSISLEKSVGSAEARNIGIKEAKNEIIALTDSDCFVSRNWPYLCRFAYNARSTHGCDNNFHYQNLLNSVPKFPARLDMGMWKQDHIPDSGKIHGLDN